MMLLLVVCSLHSLAALSVDRFVLLARPLRYKDYFNWKRATLIVIGCWVISVLVAFPPLAGFGQYEFNTIFANCHPRWTGESNGIPHIYYILFVGVEVTVPIVILTVTNVWTYKIVSGALRKRFKRQKSFRDAPKSEQERQKVVDENRDYKHKQRQLVKVFGALLIGHIITWTPTLTIMIIAIAMGAASLPIQVYIFGWISFLSNPVLHPIIESFFIKDLRHKVNKAKGKVRNSFRNVSDSVMSRTPSLLSRSWSSKSLLRRISSKKFSDIPDSPPIDKQTFENGSNSNRVSPVLEHHHPTANIPKSVQLSMTSNGGNSPLITPVSFITEVTPFNLAIGGFPMPVVVEAPEGDTELVGSEPAITMQTSATSPSAISKDDELHVTFAEVSGTDHTDFHNQNNEDSNLQNGRDDVKQESSPDIPTITVPNKQISAIKVEDGSSQKGLKLSDNSETQMENGLNQFEFIPYTVTPL